MGMGDAMMTRGGSRGGRRTRPRPPVQVNPGEREEFFALLSHELMTPLSCILGWSQLALGNPETAALALDMIERNARRERRMLDELLAEWRFDDDRLLLTPSHLQIWKAIPHPVHIPERSEGQLSFDFTA